MKKRFIVLFAIMAMLCCLPLAARAEIVEQGSCGENVIYTLDDQGTLTISGEGNMESYNVGYPQKDSPFNNNGNIKNVIIEDGVTSIGTSAFEKCYNMTSVEIPDSVTSIGYSVFQNCTALQEITIPDSVTKLGMNVCYNCSALAKVTIGENVTTIGAGTFYACDALTTVTFNAVNFPALASNTYTSGPFYQRTSIETINIGDKVETIPRYLFKGCSGIKEVNISKSVTNIASNAFSGCDSIEWVYYTGDASDWKNIKIDSSNTSLTSARVIYGEKYRTENGYLCYSGDKITAYIGTDIELVIPNEINGEKITAINESAFKDNTDLVNIIIPDSVTDIRESAFSGCTCLTSITIPNSVTNIGESAFYGCSGLTSITIPDSVTNIGNSAFSHCSGLTSVIIPDSVTSIASYTFKNCSSLKSVTIGKNITISNGNEFEGCSSLTDVYYRGTADEFAVSASNIRNTNSENIKLHCSDTTIENWGKCTGTAIYYLDSNGTLNIRGNGGTGDYYGYTYAPWSKNKQDIKNIVLSEGITSIGERAFYGCNGITSINIPDSVERIGERAFEGCTALTGVSIGRGLTVIGDAAFEKCTALKDVYINDINQWCSINFVVEHHDPIEIVTYYYSSNPMYYAENLYVGGNLLTELNIPECMTSVRYKAFYHCKCLESVNIPDSVTFIDECAFLGCSNLKKVTIGNNVTSINESAFESTGLKEITIPASVKQIRKNAFADCKDIEKVVMCGEPQYLEYISYYNRDQEIGMSPFASSNVLKEYVFTDNVTNINKYAFRGCTSLEMVTLSKNVTTIPDELFLNCSKLKEVTLPVGTTSIGKGAFSNCSNLIEITVPDGAIHLGDEAFKNCTNLKTVSLGNGITEIGKNTFHSCKSLTNLSLGKNIVNIDEGAFSACSALEDIIIPDGVESIDPHIFTGCSNLKYVNVSESHQTYSSEGGVLFSKDNSILIYHPMGRKETKYIIPPNVMKINKYAFLYNKNLTTVVVPDGMTRIDNYSFSHCTKLTTLGIPLSVQNIANNALESSNNLSDIYYAGSAQQWQAINIGATGNESIGNAIIHYNSTDIPDIATPELDPTPTPYTPLECNVDYEVVDNNITFTVEVKDITRADELKNVQLYAAEFDENGRFIGLTTGAKSEVQDGKITITAAVPDTEDYKFFLWDSFLAPLMSVLDSNNITQ